jgi:hypothetical protein
MATSVVDTLSQRSLGLPDSINASLQSLLKTHHWIFLGYSGADLAAAPNYLALRSAAAEARGWTWLVRKGWDPLPAVTKLRDDFHGKGVIDFGELPGYLEPLYEVIGELGAPIVKSLDTAGAGPPSGLEERVKEWGDMLDHVEAATCVADLLLATKNTDLAVELLTLQLENARERLDSQEVRREGERVCCLAVA